MEYYVVRKSSTDELYHHGVKGMKWGVRRTSAQLGHKVDKLATKNKKLSSDIKDLKAAKLKYDKKSVAMQTKNSKYEKRIAKATAKKAKVDYKLNKQLKKRNVDTDKVGELTAKSEKYNQKIVKAQRKLKYNKYALKSEEARVAAENAKAQIESNEKMIKMYKSTIKALDAGTVKQGRVFMQYVFEED